MKSAAPIFAGFDGGGTRTTCVLCDSTGNVLGVGYGGRANYHDFGVANAVASLRIAFDAALRGSGLERNAIRLEASFGLAGLDSPKDFSTMTGAVSSMKLATSEDAIVVNDWRTAVTGAFIDEPGVTLIAGTGCVAAAQRDSGEKVVRVGGWGHIVDDRGSAYDIGREALYAAMRDYDRRGPRTKLLELLMAKLKVSEPQGIIERVYADDMAISEIASLSTVVSEAANDGDRVAKRMLEEKGKILGELVVSAASNLRMLRTRFGVSFNGGVFRAGEPLLRPLEQTILSSAPFAKLVEAKLPPACGAVILLFRRARLAIDTAVIGQMQSSLSRLVKDAERLPVRP